MGLCFESPPSGFAHRYVSPVDPVTRTTPRWSWVYHVSNNYAKDRTVPYAKTRAEDLFAVDEGVAVWRPTLRSRWRDKVEKRKREMQIRL
jgi:hypothetical protein